MPLARVELRHHEEELVLPAEPELLVKPAYPGHRDGFSGPSCQVQSDARKAGQPLRRDEGVFQGGPAVLLVDDDQMVRPTRRSALQLQVEAVFQGRAAAVEVEPVRRVDDLRTPFNTMVIL